MPATSLQPVPSQWHGILPSKSLGGFRGPRSRSSGEAFGVKAFHGSWCRVAPQVMPSLGCTQAQYTLTCLSPETQPVVSEVCSGGARTEPTAWTGNGGGR